MSDAIGADEIEIAGVGKSGGGRMQPLDELVKINCDRKESKRDEEQHNIAAHKRKVIGKPRTRDSDKIRDDVLRNLTCCNTWRCRGWFVFFLLLCATLFFGILLFTSSSNMHGPFALISRPFAWVFLVIEILYILQVLMLVSCWKQYISEWTKRNYGSNRKKKKLNFIKKLKTIYRKKFGLNGRYYLWKLSLLEIFENWWQYYNLRSVFLCNLPVSVTFIICLVVAFESALRSLLFGRRLWCSGRNSIRLMDRDFQILCDMMIDFFFLIFPWSMIFMTGVKLIPRVTLQVVLLPAISLFGKLRYTLLQTLRAHIEEMITQEENIESDSVNRQRISIYGASRGKRIEAEQNEYFPRWAKIAVFGSSFVYCILIIATIVTQLISLPRIDASCADLLQDATQILWTNGCKIKTPFCKNVYVATCGCASIDIISHNMTTLPDGIVGLVNLRRLAIRNGPLMQLPDNMDNLKELAYIDFEFNNLQHFDIDLSQYAYLDKIFIRFNNITHVHDSFWKHETLTMIKASSNIGLQIPLNPEDIYLPNVYFLDVRNNSVMLPSTLGADQLPSIIFLLLDGNRVSQTRMIDIETLFPQLASLGMARCGLTRLPLYLPKFKYLRNFDARDNNITSVPKEVTRWIQEREIEAYFSGNDILCQADDAIYAKYCEKICSKYCWSRGGNKDDHCDPSCNSKDCNYDGGKCKWGKGGRHVSGLALP
jgi:hypothetical protein